MTRLCDVIALHGAAGCPLRKPGCTQAGPMPTQPPSEIASLQRAHGAVLHPREPAAAVPPCRAAAARGGGRAAAVRCLCAEPPAHVPFTDSYAPTMAFARALTYFDTPAKEETLLLRIGESGARARAKIPSCHQC